MSCPGKVIKLIDADADVELNLLPATNESPNANANPNENPEAETETETSRGLSDAAVRQRFISKVYGILTIQFCLTIVLVQGILFLGIYIKPEDSFSVHAVPFILPAVLIPFRCCCCCPWADVKRRAPGNYILLLLFPLVEGIALGMGASQFKTPLIILFVVVVGTVTLSISLFTLQTKWGFTACRGTLLVLLVVLVLWGLCSEFLVEFAGFSIGSVTWASFFAFWFCYGFVCNTHLLLRNGGKGSKLTPDDFIYVALTIHLDMFIIFYLFVVAVSIVVFILYNTVFSVFRINIKWVKSNSSRLELHEDQQIDS